MLAWQLAVAPCVRVMLFLNLELSGWQKLWPVCSANSKAITTMSCTLYRQEVCACMTECREVWAAGQVAVPAAGRRFHMLCARSSIHSGSS